MLREVDALAVGATLVEVTQEAVGEDPGHLGRMGELCAVSAGGGGANGLEGCTLSLAVPCHSQRSCHTAHVDGLIAQVAPATVDGA